MPSPNYRAFTTHFNGRTNQLITDIGVSLPTTPQTLPPTTLQSFKAIWDTGATNTCITINVINALQLQPIGRINTCTAGGNRECNQYLVNINLPSGVTITMVRVIECEQLTGGNDILIGMDIISIGDFSVTHADGTTTMTYRTPSIKTIDYVEEANRLATQTPKHSSIPRQKIISRRKQEKRNKKNKHK